jgi:hypothetical protein
VCDSYFQFDDTTIICSQYHHYNIAIRKNVKKTEYMYENILANLIKFKKCVTRVEREIDKLKKYNMTGGRGGGGTWCRVCRVQRG